MGFFFFPRNLISNRYQVTTFVKCPFFFLFIKTAPQKKQKQQTQRGGSKSFKVRPTYNEIQIMTTMFLKPSRMSLVHDWMCVCVCVF